MAFDLNVIRSLSTERYSIGSKLSVASIDSTLSAYSILSIGSVGSFLSIGSAGSISRIDPVGGVGGVHPVVAQRGQYPLQQRPEGLTRRTGATAVRRGQRRSGSGITGRGR